MKIAASSDIEATLERLLWFNILRTTLSALTNLLLEPPVFPVLTSVNPSPVNSDVNLFQVKSFGLLFRRWISFSFRVIFFALLSQL